MLSLASLNPQNFTPVQAPNPIVRQKSLADARGMQQQEKLRGQQIQQNEGEIQSQQAAMQKAKAVTDALVKNQGDFAKALPELKTIDPQFALGVEKELQGIATSKATVERQKRDDEIKLVELEGKEMDRLGQTVQDALTNSLNVRKQEETERQNLFERLKGPTPENLASDEKAIDDLMKREGMNYADAYRRIHPLPVSQGSASERLAAGTDIDAYVNALSRGELQPANVPIAVRDKVLKAAQDQGVMIVSDTERAAIGALDSAVEILKDVKKYSEKIHTSEGIGARVGGLVRQGASAAGYDADTTSLQSKAGELALIIRALGEKGALAEGDVQRGLLLLPVNPRLTKTEAQNQLKDLEGIFKKVRESKIKTTTQPIGGGARGSSGGGTMDRVRQRLLGQQKAK